MINDLRLSVPKWRELARRLDGARPGAVPARIYHTSARYVLEFAFFSVWKQSWVRSGIRQYDRAEVCAYESGGFFFWEFYFLWVVNRGWEKTVAVCLIV